MADEAEHCANPLLLKWIKEWLDQARERNTKAVTTYKNAYNALKACPITFNHPSQLQQLRGFGPTLCGRLTEKMKKHCETPFAVPYTLRQCPLDSTGKNEEPQRSFPHCRLDPYASPCAP